MTSAAGASAPFSRQRTLAIVATLLLGVFLGTLDQTIVASSIRTIADDFHAYTLQAWVTTAYLITSTIVVPIYGKISDIFGRRPCYVFAIALFVIGSFLCAFATSIYELSAFRALQGIGAGGMMSLAFTILGDIIAPRERAKYQGYFIAVITSSSVLGPLVGGLFANAHQILGITGWRWVFLVNVPIGVVALLVVLRVLVINRAPRKRRIDWPGGVALAVTLVPLLVVCEQGQEWGWGSPGSLACYAVFVVGVVAYVLAGKAMGDDALIPLRVFGNRQFALGLVIAFIVGAVTYGGTILLPQYFQLVHGASPATGGLMLLPLVVGSMIGAVASGQIIAHTGKYRVHSIIGAGLSAAGMFWLSTTSAATNLVLLLAVTFAVGFGLGIFGQPMTVVMQNILPPQEMGVSTGGVTFFRQIGGTVGLAAILSLLFSGMAVNVAHEASAAATQPAYQQALAQLSHNGDPSATGLVSALQGNADAARTAIEDASTVGSLPDVLAAPFRQAFADSMNEVFLVAAVLSLLGLIGFVCWKPVSLRGRSGIEEAAAQRKAGKPA